MSRKPSRTRWLYYTLRGLLGQAKLTGKNNYCTTDFEQAADTGLTLIDLGMSDSSFFRNAKDGDFTVIDTGSTVYTQEYGDPRWITVSEY